MNSSYLNDENIVNPTILDILESGDQNQYQGNYQEATKKYLQALEAACKYLDNSEEPQNKSQLALLRAVILSKIGDNLIYVGQSNIAVEFYLQQLKIATDIGSNFDMAAAHHKVGFCHYFMGLHKSSIDFQNQSLAILAVEEEQLEFKSLKCKIHLLIGLNQRKFEQYELAEKSYEEALGIARTYGLQKEEAEIIASLSLIIIDNIRSEDKHLKPKLVEKTRGELYYSMHIAKDNPYVRTLALIDIARSHEETDIDIAKGYFDEAMAISRKYDLPFAKEIQNDLSKVLQKQQELILQSYILQDQPWYSQEFPRIPEIENNILEILGFEADFVIVTATPTELKAVVRLLEPDPDIDVLPCRLYTPDGQYYIGKFGHYKTVVVQCSMGTRNEGAASFVTLKALENWNPKAIIMVGIAFGKSPIEQEIGDVLVSTEIIDYDVNRIGLDGIVDRGKRPPSNRNLLVLFEQAYEWKFDRPDGSACKLIPGPILSGDKLVDNPEFKADLFKRFPHAKGGEMEGVGFCAAANSLQKPWVLIKAICDWADGKKSDNYQPLAAAAAASLVHHVLLQKTILNSFR
jgi:nucleoside phosphorylase